MSKEKHFVHPYIPNSVPDVKTAMMKEIGVNEIEELYEDIPEALRYKGELNLPEPLPSEYALKRHMEQILSRNITCRDTVSFLGGGCWQHYVPAICDEVNQRSEFLTAYAGEPYEDHGRFQALFEYASMMGELLDMDVVNIPTFDWSQAAGTSVRMASRITGRPEILAAGTIAPDRLSVMRNYCEPQLRIRLVDFHKDTGLLDLDDLREKISADTCGVYIENPSYLGNIEHQGESVAEICRTHGALFVVGIDPLSLGILSPPAHYGADIVCGDIQPLGMHMHFGGALAGFIATRDEEQYVMEYPSRLFGITATEVEGEYGFGDVTYDRTSFGSREQGKEFVGTAAALWGITAGVYLALLGPQGIRKTGTAIVYKSHYARMKISQIKGVRLPFLQAPHFKEFIVDFSESGKSVKEVNAALRDRGIFGGKDISGEFPGLGQRALYCVTEVHTKGDIDHLVSSMDSVLNE
ncbi:aminomethyl-transferring glycine dehydrogenase subunit GcvPA [candidate division KSB1 bacterium]